VPRLDPAATLRLHDVVNAATLAWTPDMPEGRVRAYVEKHGAAHLLSADRVDDARARLADPAYMAAFAEAWDSEVQPLAAWRVVGEAAVESALLDRCAERGARSATRTRAVWPRSRTSSTQPGDRRPRSYSRVECSRERGSRKTSCVRSSGSRPWRSVSGGRARGSG
jgi:hypothetical protein